MKKGNESLKNCSNSCDEEIRDSDDYNMNDKEVNEESEEIDYCNLSNEGIKTDIRNKAFKLIIFELKIS